jgi:hypothetical protein
MSLHRVLQEVKLHNTKLDLKVWNLYTDGFEGMECSGSCSFQRQVWKFIAPPKIQNFIWLVIQKKLCMRSFLCIQLLLPLDWSFCPFYTNIIETTDHVLIYYQFAWKLWTKLFSWRGSLGVFQTHLMSHCINSQ